MYFWRLKLFFNFYEDVENEFIDVILLVNVIFRNVYMDMENDLVDAILLVD